MSKELTLKNAPLGKLFKIKNVTGEACLKLREAGFCEGLDLCKISNDRCILCSICGTKYAISKDLSDSVVLNENPTQSP